MKDKLPKTGEEIGKFNIEDAVSIQYDVEKRYNKTVITAKENEKQES